MNRITRRSILGHIGQASAVAAISLTAPRAFSASIYGNHKASAFALAGDRYHNIDYVRTALSKTLGKDLGISIDFTDELSLLAAKRLKDYKLLIILRDGMVWPNGYAA